MADTRVEAIFDDKEVVSFLKSMTKKLQDVKGGEKRFVGLLSAIVFSDVIDHFDKQQGEDGPWKEWSPPYEDYLKSIGRSGNKILQFSGRLRQNFKPGSVRKENAGFLWFNDAQTKNGFPYAAAHDEGGGRLPKRNFMWLSDKGAENISDQTLAFILEEGI